MPKMLLENFQKIQNRIIDFKNNKKYRAIYEEFKDYTIIPKETYIDNLILADIYRKVDGAIVECGVWRGGMIAGIAKLFSDQRDYYLFDSFEGLPQARDVDGEDTIQWQKDQDNTMKAEIDFAQKAMRLSGTRNYHFIKGWFKDTLPKFKMDTKIAILRLDGDLYDSTMDCLTYLYPFLSDDGIIIVDDYYFWEGCTKAVHDYLSKHQLCSRLRQFGCSVCYLIKKDKKI